VTPMRSYQEGQPEMSWHDLLRTRASGWIILIRLMVGLAVFFPEGIQKLIFPEILGAGRFTRIGIPLPDVMDPFVGCAARSSLWAC